MTLLFATALRIGLRARLQRLPLEGDTMPPTDADDTNLRIARGTDVRYLLTCYDEDDQLVDLSGLAVSVRVKRLITDPVALFELAIGDGVTLSTQSGDTLGQLEILFAGARTAALDPGALVWEARGVLSGDTSSLIHPSAFILEREV